MSRRRRRPFQPGVAPGTIRIDPESPKPAIRVLAYGPERCVAEPVADPRRLADHLGRWPVVWVNVDGLGDADVLLSLAETFRLHRLALEDVVNVHQRAKVEIYEDHLFVVLRMPGTDPGGPTEQVCLFLGDGYVLTFQERAGDCFDPVRERIRHGKGRIRKSGADYLAYALTDAVIDGYFPLLESIGDRLESLEPLVFSAPERGTMVEILELKSHLREIRRTSWPHRDLAHALLREDTPRIEDSTRLYLRDCADHAVQITELTGMYREVATDLMNGYLSTVGNRTNDIMKFLTIVASVFIPLGFIAGLYGMNFDPDASRWNMPELSWGLGYPAVLLLMALVAGGLVVFFKRKGWLG